MAIAPGNQGGCGSQFFLTLGPAEYLDGKHQPFGSVVEGLEVLEELNNVFVDTEGRPLKDVRIRHVIVLGTILLDSRLCPILYLWLIPSSPRYLTLS